MTDQTYGGPSFTPHKVSRPEWGADQEAVGYGHNGPIGPVYDSLTRAYPAPENLRAETPLTTLLPRAQDSDKNSVGAVGLPPERYKTESGMQPFDVIDVYDLTYYEASLFKYLVRWRKKDGLTDLKKALHFLEEAAIRAEKADAGRTRPQSLPTEGYHPEDVTEAFGLEGKTGSATRCLLNACLSDAVSKLHHLDDARRYLQAEIAKAESDVTDR